MTDGIDRLLEQERRLLRRLSPAEARDAAKAEARAAAGLEPGPGPA